MRCYFNIHIKADVSQINLPHGTKNQKSGKKEKLESTTTDQKYR